VIPTPRYCPRCRRYVLCGRAEVFGRRIRACQACGAETKKKAPRGRPRASKPLGWKRAAAKAAHTVDPDTWQAIVVFYGGRCSFCEERPWEEQDHLKPIAHGGTNTADNIVPACRPCNREKGTSEKWAPRRRHPFMEAAL
jgi:5-methylcytosine-specific restriction endonuclease McrA